jgi:hypothetical protein
MRRRLFTALAGVGSVVALVFGPEAALASSVESPAVVTLLDPQTLSVPVRITCAQPADFELNPTNTLVVSSFVAVSLTQEGSQSEVGFHDACVTTEETKTLSVRVIAQAGAPPFHLGAATVQVLLDVVWCCKLNPPCQFSPCFFETEQVQTSGSASIVPKGTQPPDAVPPF